MSLYTEQKGGASVYKRSQVWRWTVQGMLAVKVPSSLTTDCQWALLRVHSAHSFPPVEGGEKRVEGNTKGT